MDNKKQSNTIIVYIPKRFMNFAVTTDNSFVSDTNDSANWETMKLPLPTPKGEWSVNNINVVNNNHHVELIDVEKVISDDEELGGYTRIQWKNMIDDKVVSEPSEEVLAFVKSLTI